MIVASKLRNGVFFQHNKKPYKVTNYKHTHLSRGGGSVKVKARDLSTGKVNSFTFKSTEKFEEVEVGKKSLQYLYMSDDKHVFMDPVSFEQIEVEKSEIKDEEKFLKEGEEMSVVFWKEKVLGMDLPPKMNFKIAEAAPGERGNSASNVYKDAKLENGLKVRVPLFVNKGDMVRVDTRTGEYVERA